MHAYIQTYIHVNTHTYIYTEFLSFSFSLFLSLFLSLSLSRSCSLSLDRSLSMSLAPSHAHTQTNTHTQTHTQTHTHVHTRLIRTHAPVTLQVGLYAFIADLLRARRLHQRASQAHANTSGTTRCEFHTHVTARGVGNRALSSLLCLSACHSLR